MTHVERIEQNKKLEGLSERKGGIEDHMSFLREYIGTGNPNIFRYHGSIYVKYLSHSKCDSKILHYLITELN